MEKASKLFDVIVVGAGSGGLNIAGFMNRAGFSVLLMDKEGSSHQQDVSTSAVCHRRHSSMLHD